MEPADLYGLPLEQFTAQRNALAKELRRQGQRDEADRVSRVRKPSVAAWAVNQLVRTQRRELDALFKTGDALQKAQADLLAGSGDPQALRHAVDAERAAVDELADRARGLLTADGHELTPARLEQVSETLHAAALDPDARSVLHDGCLERELRHIGLGALTAGAKAGGRAKVSSKAPARQPAKRSEKAKARQADLRKEEAAARRRLTRAERDLEAAEQRRRRAEAELREAEEALTRARGAADTAQREHTKTEKALG